MRLISRSITALVTLGCLSVGMQATGQPITLAVFGDWPYSKVLLDNAGLLLNSVNADPDVSLVMHLGDIHAGSDPCTSAGIEPPIPTANPGWNRKVYDIFARFNDPLVYTPGDNEWTDCHRKRSGSSGDPLKELAALRSLFFAQPERTLGKQRRKVSSQAVDFDPAYPDDAQFAENLMWQESGIVFLTVNMPGSSNDALPWQGRFENKALQEREIAARTSADIRWMQRAFGQADKTQAKAVVLAMQADMWERYAAALGGRGLRHYTRFVKKLAALSVQFARPVLLLNGDSHHYGWDQPMADPASFTGRLHGTPAVPNLTRIIVQGATEAPAEWLKLSIDPEMPYPFSWRNVPYCSHPERQCNNW